MSVPHRESATPRTASRAAQQPPFTRSQFQSPSMIPQTRNEFAYPPMPMTRSQFDPRPFSAPHPMTRSQFVDAHSYGGMPPMTRSQFGGAQPPMTRSQFASAYGMNPMTRTQFPTPIFPSDHDF